jgi:hypothetical protein
MGKLAAWAALAVFSFLLVQALTAPMIGEGTNALSQVNAAILRSLNQ